MDYVLNESLVETVAENTGLADRLNAYERRLSTVNKKNGEGDYDDARR